MLFLIFFSSLFVLIESITFDSISVKIEWNSFKTMHSNFNQAKSTPQLKKSSVWRYFWKISDGSKSTMNDTRKDTESSYQYEGNKGDCRFKTSDIGATVSGFVDLPSRDEQALKKAVGQIGPISVAIDGGQSSIQHYSQDVYYEPACSSDSLHHAILAVGYGSEQPGGDYWLGKNSWGDGWGDHGYIKMSRNRDNNCGIATAAIYPLV